MINHFCKTELWKCSTKLCDVAMGRAKADLVIVGGKLINVCTHEILDNVDVAIACGRIARVGDCKYCIGPDTKVIEANGRYVAPAFMDGHIHVESAMITAGEYAKAVIPHGTSGIFMDPHEICNVVGLEGVKCMLDDTKRTPLKAMLTTPSCVPAVQGFEDAGATITSKDVADTMLWDECVGLGEMMNFPGVIYSNPETHAIIGETLKSGKIVTGHFSIPETENSLNAYIASGVRCCHESTREEDALAKMRMGMYALLREGSAWHDVQEVVKAITRHEVDSRFACLVSDDAHPETLIKQGHIDHIVKRAIEEGVDPVTAIQMVTINVAQCFHLDHEMGSVAPGKCADMVIIDQLESCKVNEVFINGQLVAKEGKPTFECEPYEYPEFVKNTIHMNKTTEEDFHIKAVGNKAHCRVIEVIPAKVPNVQRIIPLEIKDGKILPDTDQDVLKVAVFERHNYTGTRGLGFVKGFGIKEGALAQTVAHDAHNMLVIGSNDKDMMLAVNTLIESGGGSVAVKNGEILGRVDMPIAGLMSDKSLEETSKSVEGLSNAWKEMGSTLPSPFMTMALIALACLPELRLTNQGLVDCTTFEKKDLVVKIEE